MVVALSEISGVAVMNNLLYTTLFYLMIIHNHVEM